MSFEKEQDYYAFDETSQNRVAYLQTLQLIEIPPRETLTTRVKLESIESRTLERGTAEGIVKIVTPAMQKGVNLQQRENSSIVLTNGVGLLEIKNTTQEPLIVSPNTCIAMFMPNWALNTEHMKQIKIEESIKEYIEDSQTTQMEESREVITISNHRL